MSENIQGLIQAKEVEKTKLKFMGKSMRWKSLSTAMQEER